MHRKHAACMITKKSRKDGFLDTMVAKAHFVVVTALVLCLAPTGAECIIVVCFHTPQIHSLLF